MKGLFINNTKAKDSIYESGRMVYESLMVSDKYTLDYLEVSINERQIPSGFDFYLFNYHPVTMGWLHTKHLKKLGFVITIVLEILPDDPFVMCSSKDFNAYCVIDPTLKSKKANVYSFPRPLEKIDFPFPEVNNKIPVIGTFGFATKGKGFHHVVEAVNLEFEQAIVKINIPYGDYVPDSREYAFYLENICKQKAKDGIQVLVTHDFMEKDELIKWCAANTLNCFLYDRDVPGLAATTDQAIISGRPLSISKNNTFRHILAYLPPYPKWSLRDSINNSGSLIKQMRQDWSTQNFSKKFEVLLDENLFLMNRKNTDHESMFTLPVNSFSISQFVEKRLKKYKRKFKKVMLTTLLKGNDPKYSKKII